MVLSFEDEFVVFRSALGGKGWQCVFCSEVLLLGFLVTFVGGYVLVLVFVFPQ